MAIMETELLQPHGKISLKCPGVDADQGQYRRPDYFSLIAGYKHTPTSTYLYNPQNNIEVGTGYLAILADRYLRVSITLKLEYAMISSYNGGAETCGKVWTPLATNSVPRSSK